jgi:uncharacterized delta-60 repeat protein
MRSLLLLGSALAGGLHAACGLDAGFGSGGYQLFASPSGGAAAIGYDTLLLSDGRVLVAGAGERSGDRDAAWWCLDAAGALQGSAGYHALAGGADEEFFAAAQAPGGGPVYLAGYAVDGVGSTLLAVRRLSFPALGVDTGFAGGLLTLTAAGPANGVAVAANGDVYLAAANQLWRILDDGTPDPGFGSGGVLQFDALAQAWDLQKDSQGRLLISGAVPSGVGLWRRTAGGAVDAGFGGAGKVTASVGGAFDYGELAAISILAGDAVMATGYLNRSLSGNSAWLALKVDAGGSGDPGFGVSGLAQGPESSSFIGQRGAAGALQAEGGAWLLCGNSVGGLGETPALWRLLADGSADSGFGTGGRLDVSATGGQIRRPRRSGALAYATGYLGSGMALWRFSACDPVPTPTPDPAALDLGSAAERAIAYPNPARGRITLAWQQAEAAGVTLTVFDERGVVLRREARELGAGPVQWALDLGAFSPGVYLYALQSSQGAVPPPSKFVVLP